MKINGKIRRKHKEKWNKRDPTRMLGEIENKKKKEKSK